MDMDIYLTKSGKTWQDGFPIGNGSLGAMICGKINDEIIVLNEETLCYGPARKRTNPEGKEHLAEIQDLLLRNELEEAAFLARMSLSSTPKYNNPYQPLGDLKIHWMHHDQKVKDYGRRLDIDRGVVEVSYSMGDYKYQRQHVASIGDKVIVVRLTTSNPKGMSLCVNINRKPFEEHTGPIDACTVGNWGENGSKGMRYMSAVRMFVSGDASKHVHVMGDFVYVKGEQEVILFISGITDYGERRLKKKEAYGNLRKRIELRLDMAQKKGYQKIYEEQVVAYQRLYHRFEMNMYGGSPYGGNEQENKSQKENSSLGCEVKPMDLWLEEVRNNDSRAVLYLTLCLVNYARYLMIASSYHCLMPANLQGIWNGDYMPPWMSQYTININTQMNYWFVEKVGLSECHKPLFKLIERLYVNGKKTARDLYGRKGFCAHHNTNIWANADPEGIFDTSPYWPNGGAWLCLHLYEHYAFTNDLEFLEKKAMPLMRQAIRFYEDGFVSVYKEGHAYKVTGPSLSPENTYMSKEGQRAALCMGPTMDNMILNELICDYLKGIEVLLSRYSIKPVKQQKLLKDRKVMKDILDALPRINIDEQGRIKEWMEDVQETEPGHRHISHLFALHPGSHITKDTPDLYLAAHRTLDDRIAQGGGHTGWSKAWISCFMARLKDGQGAYKNIREMIGTCFLDNLLDVHPPFQIDGNFGFAEAVIEMLVQSHAGYVDLLPALPKEWEEGYIKGVGLRGGMTADIFWQKGHLSKCLVTSTQDSCLDIRYKSYRKEMELFKGQETLVEFTVEKGGV